MSNKPIHALIDADLIQYRFAIANQKKDGTVDTVSAEVQSHNYIDKIINRIHADKVTLIFSGPRNFRKTVNRCYKANRQGEKPILHSHLRKVLCEKYPNLIVDGLEADDVLGILCTEPQTDEHRVLVSYDKDMKTLPVTIFNPNTDEIVTVDEFDAEKMFWTQCITGDSTDGYYGIPGIGPKGAEAIVNEIMLESSQLEKFAILLREYEHRYLDKEYCLRQCQMAHILQHGDYDHKTRTVKLWDPTTENGRGFQL